LEAGRLSAARGLDRAAAVGVRSPYPFRAALLARRGQPRDAWNALEADLARGLLDEQAQRRPTTLTPEERNKLTELTDGLTAARGRVLFLYSRTERSQAEQQELKDLATRLRQLDGQLADLAVAVSRREVASLNDVRKALPDDAALVAWVDRSFPGIEEHWVCVVRPTGDPVWERLPGTGPGGKWTRQDTDLPWRLRFALVGDRTTAPASA